MHLAIRSAAPQQIFEHHRWPMLESLLPTHWIKAMFLGDFRVGRPVDRAASPQHPVEFQACHHVFKPPVSIGFVCGIKRSESGSHQDGIHRDALHLPVLLQCDLKTLLPLDLIDTGIQKNPDVGITGRLPDFFFHHAGAAGHAALRRLAGKLGGMTAQCAGIFNQNNGLAQSRQIDGGTEP